jgi:hypothetical protein
MMKRTTVALAAILAAATLAPVANAEGCSGPDCDRRFRVNIDVTLPDDFGFAHADGSFTANADNNSVETSGSSSATAAATDGGMGEASNTTSAGGTAENGATAGGSSTSSASASGGVD